MATKLTFINTFGRQIDPHRTPSALAPKPKRAKKNLERNDQIPAGQQLGTSRGYIVSGVGPARLSAARQLAKSNREVWDEASWLRRARPTALRREPYTLLSAAEKCEEMARKGRVDAGQCDGGAVRPVAALFVRTDSVYRSMDGVDCWDIDRDALTWPGGSPVVAHPPCARWSKMNSVVLARHPHRAAEFAWGNDGGTFAFALGAVRRWGGVLEHPAESMAFEHFALPRMGSTHDRYGGWAAEIRQADWGHRAEKRTWLYIVGCDPDGLPARPPSVRARGRVETMGRAEREHTPPEFAAWLVELARRCEGAVNSRSSVQR